MKIILVFSGGFGKIFKAESVFALDKQISQQVPKSENNFASTTQTIG